MFLFFVHFFEFNYLWRLMYVKANKKAQSLDYCYYKNNLTPEFYGCETNISVMKIHF